MERAGSSKSNIIFRNRKSSIGKISYHAYSYEFENTNNFRIKSLSLITTILDTSWYGIIWTTRSSQIIEQDLISNVQQIGIHLSTDFYLRFELVSIILLVALIGAIAMACQ